MAARRKRPILCYVTDRHGLSPVVAGDSTTALLGKMDALVRAGVDWIQIREKDLSGRAAGALVRESLARAKRCTGPGGRETRILVNDRLDIAWAENAGGVHLGENSVPFTAARHLLDMTAPAGPRSRDFLIGVSAHSLDAAKAAGAANVDYIIFGPVFATPSKAPYGAPQGLARLRKVCAAVDIPVLAIGGITLENAAMCGEAGAAGIAAIRLFQDAPDPYRTVLRLREAMRQTSPDCG